MPLAYKKKVCLEMVTKNFLGDTTARRKKKKKLIGCKNQKIHYTQDILKGSHKNLLRDYSAGNCHWEVFFVKGVLFFHERAFFSLKSN